MMLNTKKIASIKQQKKQETQITPLKLKDLNVECSSSTSSEAPKGCLRLFFSNYSSNSSKNKPKCNNVVKKGSNLVKLGENYSAKYDLSDGVNKFTSGFQYKLCDDHENVVNLGKHGKRCDFSDEINKFSTGFGNNVSDNAEDFTAVNKLGGGLGFGSFCRNSEADELVENDTECTDAPVQGSVSVSVSPEIQGGLLTSVTAGTTAKCNAAGLVLSGVSDRRKCRAVGILAVRKDNLFGSGESKGFGFEGESVVRERRNRRDSIVPFPSEASASWLSSPCDEKRSEKQDGDDNMCGLRVNQCDELLPFEFVRAASSPSSSLGGFSSDLFDKSNCTISTSDATSTTPDSRRNLHSVQHSDVSSEIRGVLGPSVDHFASNLSPPSPISPNTDSEKLVSPTLEDSLGIKNVMRSPESNCNYRSPNIDLSDLSRDQISRLWFECELDSVTEVLRRVSISPECQISELDSPRASFEFNPLIKRDNSIDLTLLREAMDMGTPDSEARISWREGLASRMFEMDNLDCCEYLSDEDDYANGCHGWPRPCLKSVDSDEIYELVPNDSSWTVCYINDLFQP